MRKLLIPSPENRAACMQQLWDKLHIEQRNEESLSEDFDRLARHLDAASTGKAALAGSDLGRGFLTLALIARRESALGVSDAYFRRSFAFVYWARELSIVARKAPGLPELAGDNLLVPLVTWQALATACGSPWFALWLAPHLHNQFAHPDPELPLGYYSFDDAGRRFMALLQRILITGLWPERLEVAELSAYGRLLQACQGPAAQWPDALMAYCDWRIANAFGYAEMGATKRRRQSAMASVLDVEREEQVFPVELLALRFAHERATGQLLPLNAPHPLLQGPLMAHPFPMVEPMYEDEWTRRLGRLRESALAEQSPLRAPIVARFL